MSAEFDSHPPDEVLRNFGLGKLTADSPSTILSHLEKCDTCRQQVALLSGDSFLDRLRVAEGHSVTPGQDTPVAGLVSGTLPAPGRPVIPGLPAELVDNSQYEVVGELGRGGMGVVYLARNRQMDRLEVLKVMGRELLTREGARQRFEREIKSAARLNHPNVVAAYSVLPLPELLVFAMEYVEGEDLARAVKTRGPLPVANACYYAYQVALGLEHARNKGMVHRDIKPQNLILTRDRNNHSVKILDFGLAKANCEKGGQYELTGEGKMLGTPHYVAPEQIDDAASADIRADVYSLGCTLYYLLTGNPPFSGGTLLAILHAHHQKEAAPLNEVRPDVSEALAAVVRKMMAKRPADRYQTPAEVAQALLPFIRAKPVPADETQKPIAQDTAIASRWDVFSEPTLQPVDVGPAKGRRRSIFAPVLVAALAVGLSALWAGGVFRVKAGDGIIVVQVNEPDADVYIDGEQVKVAWENGGKTAEIRRKPGTYKVIVVKDGFTADGDTVSLGDGQHHIFTAKIERKPQPAPAAESRPQPAPATEVGALPSKSPAVAKPPETKGDLVSIFDGPWPAGRLTY
jgi:serine/threonine protein kinase